MCGTSKPDLNYSTVCIILYSLRQTPTSSPVPKSSSTSKAALLLLSRMLCVRYKGGRMAEQSSSSLAYWSLLACEGSQMPQSVSGTCPCAIRYVSLVSSAEDWLGTLRMLNIQDVQIRGSASSAERVCGAESRKVK